MQRQRYLYSALLAVLFWFLIKGFGGDIIFVIASKDLRIGAYWAVTLAICVAVAIAVVDVVMPWSKGLNSLADGKSNVARVSIGLVTSLLFGIPFMNLMSFFDLPVSLTEAFLANWMSITAAVLFALQVVEVLIRHYGRPR